MNSNQFGKTLWRDFQKTAKSGQVTTTNTFSRGQTQTVYTNLPSHSEGGPHEIGINRTAIDKNSLDDNSSLARAVAVLRWLK